MSHKSAITPLAFERIPLWGLWNPLNSLQRKEFYEENSCYRDVLFRGYLIASNGCGYLKVSLNVSGAV